MRSENKLLRSSILTFLLVLCVVPEVLGHAPRFRGLKEFLPYTRNLPRIDKIELLKLELKDDRWKGEIVASKVLKGAPAQKVASLWRRQTYTSSLSACHDPAAFTPLKYAERSALPQRGCDSKPRVAASATLGPKTNEFSTARRLRHRSESSTGRNRFAVGTADHILPRVAEAATLGFETQPLWGKGKSWLMQTGVFESSMSLPLKRFAECR